MEPRVAQTTHAPGRSAETVSRFHSFTVPGTAGAPPLPTSAPTPETVSQIHSPTVSQCRDHVPDAAPETVSQFHSFTVSQSPRTAGAPAVRDGELTWPNCCKDGPARGRS